MLASAAAAAGMPVITLPALPPEIALPVVGRLASLWQEAPKAAALVRLSSEIQDLIATRAKASELADDGLSPVALALEVTLFLPETPPSATEKEA